MADTVVELPYLSSHYSIPETTLTSLTQAPTVDLVNQLLQSITKKANEHDELEAHKIRLEVELENLSRNRDSKIKVLKEAVEKSHSELEALRKSLHESGLF
jgi:nucleoprotein TPR